MKDTDALNREKEEKEPKPPRSYRRLTSKKQAILNNLVTNFFTERSSLKDPNGEEADSLYVKYRDIWFNECRHFNARKHSYSLNFKAFAKGVEIYLKKEEEIIKMKQKENEAKDFQHWYRRSHVGRTRPLTALLYWIQAKGNREKRLHLWKNYYIQNILMKNV